VEYFSAKYCLTTETKTELIQKVLKDTLLKTTLDSKPMPLSGADIENYCKEAAMFLLRTRIESKHQS
jgi:SpoVK/Ycf46/Vps4 family AAA+-type ATPase